MINIKKGPGLSLHQVDKVGKIVDGQAIEAGHGVRFVVTDGVTYVYKGASNATAPEDAVYGFALNNQTDGDVIECGKLGAILLDGHSVVETDKAASTINYSNYPLGTKLTIATTGNVEAASGDDKVIGVVEGIRSLPSVETVEGKKIQSTRAMLGIKLLA